VEISEIPRAVARGISEISTDSRGKQYEISWYHPTSPGIAGMKYAYLPVGVI
jgi:hypothetical protein